MTAFIVGSKVRDAHARCMFNDPNSNLIQVATHFFNLGGNLQRLKTYLILHIFTLSMLDFEDLLQLLQVRIPQLITHSELLSAHKNDVSIIGGLKIGFQSFSPSTESPVQANLARPTSIKAPAPPATSCKHATEVRVTKSQFRESKNPTRPA